MKKWIIGATIGLGAAGVIAAARKGCGGADKTTMWDKMRAQMEEMPEDFPPRIMFDNVQAARENTERILAVLKKADESHTPPQRVEAAV